MLRFPMWLILFHSELPGDNDASYSFMLQPNSRYLGLTARRYSGSMSMVMSSSSRLSSARTFKNLQLWASNDPNLLQHWEAADPLELRTVQQVKFHN